ncbi:MAG TPA: hypothetical protein VK787_06630 [Puia sp.]|jgi:hypothetical protein|nr:hypothetical protein [Puia sp.]
MNEKNLDYLKDNVRYLGFGDKLHSELEKNIKDGKPDFLLSAAYAVLADTLHADLHFRKSDTQDMYFLNKYDAELRVKDKENLKQTFYLDRGKGVTAKEAYNLLSGRSVFKELTNKDGEKYFAWLKLDLREKDERGNFKVQHFYDSYGYNLKAAVNNLPLAHMTSEQEAQLFKSLQKGNIQEVKIMQDGNEVKMYLVANPQYKTLEMFDENMKPISRELKAVMNALPEKELHQKNVSTAIGENKNELSDNSSSKLLKKNVAEKKDDGTQQNNSKKKDWHAEKHERKNDSKLAKKNGKEMKEDGLMPKKRISEKKGLRI